MRPGAVVAALCVVLLAACGGTGEVSATTPEAHRRDASRRMEELTCSAREVTTLVVRVDLARKRVVGIEPGPGAAVECQPEAH